MKKLQVTNFGPVRDVDMELRDVNMLIGEQSIGKSTLAKLITIFTDHISIFKLITNGKEEWEKQLSDYNLDIYKEQAYHIVYNWYEDYGKKDLQAEKESGLRLEVSPDELNISLFDKDKVTTDKNAALDYVIKRKPIYHGDNLKRAVLDFNKSEKNSEAIDHIYDVLSSSLYIPAERIIYSVVSNMFAAMSLAGSSIPKNLLRFMVNLQNAKSTYPKYDIPLLGISYKYENSNDFFTLQNTNELLPMTAASSGIQSTTPLILVLYYAIQQREYSTFVIEEPECNLFPEKQVELLRYIIGLVKNESRTLTITTHSPYLLSAMNNYLFAGTLVDKYGEKIHEAVTKIMPDIYHLSPGECSVYSLGEACNGDGIYCKSLLDEETGMIDYNSLDGASAIMSDEFGALEDALINMKRNS